MLSLSFSNQSWYVLLDVPALGQEVGRYNYFLAAFLNTFCYRLLNARASNLHVGGYGHLCAVQLPVKPWQIACGLSSDQA